MRIRLRLGRRGKRRKTDVRLTMLCAGALCLLLVCCIGLIRYFRDAGRAAQSREAVQTLYGSPYEEPETAADRPRMRQFSVAFRKDAPEADSAAAVPAVMNWPDNPSLAVSPAIKRLQRQNKDIVGWLTLPDSLGQAVVQRDNAYYLKRDCLGYHNANGALFLEEGISLKTRPDTYIIFGHNMKIGEMFGALRLYEDAGYYRKNAVIDFNVLYEDGRYVVFAVADVDTAQGMRRYVPFMQLPGMEANARRDCIRKLQTYSQIYSPIPVDPEDQLLLLVTCMGTEESRRVVAARRLREGETQEGIAALLQSARRR